MIMILYLSEFYLLFIYLFNLLIYFTYLSEIYLSKNYQVIFLRMFYILWFINTIVLSLSYIVYRKEQSNTRGKSREKIGRKYDQVSQIVEKKCYKLI